MQSYGNRCSLPTNDRFFVLTICGGGIVFATKRLTFAITVATRMTDVQPAWYAATN